MKITKLVIIEKYLPSLYPYFVMIMEILQKLTGLRYLKHVLNSTVMHLMYMQEKITPSLMIAGERRQDG